MKFVVTGFKEFSGVKENPTEFIVKNLQDYLRVRGKPLPGDNWRSVNESIGAVCRREVYRRTLARKALLIKECERMHTGGAEAVNFTVLKVAGREVSVWLALAAKTVIEGVPEDSEIIWVCTDS